MTHMYGRGMPHLYGRGMPRPYMIIIFNKT